MVTMPTSPQPTITSLTELASGTDDIAALSGGKAAGLARLVRHGLNVPAGFVITNALSDIFPDALSEHYLALGNGEACKVAVRSSALGEDGDAASFAGQYQTVLNVIGLEDLQTAIARCVDSLHSQHADAYQQHSTISGSTMCVVVQRMVDARAAGVLFSADPVSARRDRLIIDAVPGLGEALVSGEQTPDHFELDNSNSVCLKELVSDTACLSDAEVQQLATQARDAEKKFAQPLDMEWAIDQHGELFWLQARPITTLPADLNELDTPIAPDDILTTGNISEMMPGAVCPLTFSFTFRSIEHGFQHMDVLMGAQQQVEKEFKQVAMFYGHMFINLTGKVASTPYVLGMDAEMAGHSICGQPVPQLKAPPLKSLFTRLRGGWRFAMFLRGADKTIEAFEARVKTQFKLEHQHDPRAMMLHLDAMFNWINEMEEVHVRSSATSAVSEGILQGIYCKGEEPNQQQMGVLAKLIQGADNVVSAVMLDELDVIIDLIATLPGAADHFQHAEAQAALNWLQQQSQAAELFTQFLDKHGHRAYRELCLREKGWQENPLPLIQTMQASIAARFVDQQTGRSSTEKQTIDLQQFNRAVRFILPYVHNGIRRRERTKTLLAYITREFGKAYRHLGQLLVQSDVFPDEDLVYFFTHDELLAFTALTDNAELQRRTDHAIKRREAMDYQERLQMPEICSGIPVPVSPAPVSGDSKVLHGRPVSHGIVEAPCRVAFTPAEAAELKPGEILIAPITDVAWTPYFSLIAGLATDIGSSVSHGAVIAREYGLPAVVNLRHATEVFKTGDIVRLDGDSGSLSRVE